MRARATGAKPVGGVQRLLEVATVVAEICAGEAAGVDFDEGFPVESFRAIADAGLLAAPLPKVLGGAGLAGDECGATLAQLQLLKTIGRGNLAVGRVFEGHVNALLLVALYGTPGQRETLAADARERRKIFGVWNTEAADGVRIERAGAGRFRLSGAKTFASGAGFVDRPFVNAALPDRGWQMTVVPMEAVGARLDSSWWRPPGMRATRSLRVDFTGVELAEENLIGAPDDYYRQPWFSGGAIRFAAVHLGGAEALLDATREYLRRLNRVDDPYQKARVGEMAIKVETGNLWLRGAASAVDAYLRGGRNDSDRERLVAYANMMRTAIEQICVDVMTLCERSVGARGLMRDLPIERIIRDLTFYLRQPAPDAALADVGRFALASLTPGEKLWG